MKQYCRYCANCFDADEIICTIHQVQISEQSAKRVNQCEDFLFTEVDLFNPDHRYTPRAVKPKVYDGQLKFDFGAQ